MWCHLFGASATAGRRQAPDRSTGRMAIVQVAQLMAGRCWRRANYWSWTTTPIPSRGCGATRNASRGDVDSGSAAQAFELLQQEHFDAAGRYCDAREDGYCSFAGCGAMVRPLRFQPRHTRSLGRGPAAGAASASAPSRKAGRCPGAGGGGSLARPGAPLTQGRTWNLELRGPAAVRRVCGRTSARQSTSARPLNPRPLSRAASCSDARSIRRGMRRGCQMILEHRSRILVSEPLLIIVA